MFRPNNLFCAKSARKRIAPPIESELSFSTGSFLNKYDVTDRKLKPLVIGSTVRKLQCHLTNVSNECLRAAKGTK